jgi:hypothetical protein
MFQANGKKYKAYLIDSNIVISTLKDKDNFGSKVLNIVLKDGIFVFSPVTLHEISMDLSVYNEFKKCFLVLPSLLCISRDDIVKKECEYYFSQKKLSITDLSILINESLFNKQNLSIEKIIDHHVSSQKGKLYKSNEKDNFFDMVKDKTVGFINKDEKNGKKAIQNSIELYAYQLTAQLNYSFAREISDQKMALDVKRVPSSLSTSYIYHYKFMFSRRKGEPSDISDILISNILPYIDVFLTENSLASNIKEIKHTFGFFQNLEVMTSKDIMNSQ